MSMVDEEEKSPSPTGVDTVGPDTSDRNEEEEELDDEEEVEETAEDANLSKRERKRRAKMGGFLEKRKFRRMEEKQRKKDRRAAIRASGQGETLKRPKPRKMADSACKLRLIVDMSLDNLMVDRDRRRCIAQLTFCYSANRKEEHPVQYHITSFNGPSRMLFDLNGTYSNWDVHLHREGLESIVPHEDIVYLTADSENVLTDLDESKAYVIGGLVDHNSHKGVCFEMAQQRGWAHARLPIDEFIKMQSRRVLTVNHVFEIMLIYWKTKNWEEAFFSVIPKRKGAEKKEEEEEGEEEGEGNEKEDQVFRLPVAVLSPDKLQRLEDERRRAEERDVMGEEEETDIGEEAKEEAVGKDHTYCGQGDE